MTISIFVIDAERTFADALAAWLEDQEDVEAVIPLHPQAPAPALIVGRHADVVLVDADLPGNVAIDLCEELSDRAEGTGVIMLSRSSEPRRIVDSIAAGAAAWVRKDESLELLLQNIRGVAAGETWLPRSETRAVLRLLLEEREDQRRSDQLLATLTPREREVLSYLAEGAGRSDVAERLHLSANTVRTHLHNLMAKLGVHSTLEAVALTRSRRTGLAVVPAKPKPRPTT